MRSVAVLAVAAVAALAGVSAESARADDVSLTGAVATWSLRILAPAKALQGFNASTTPAQALKASARLTSVAARGSAAIAAQSPSSAKGRNLKVLATSAFADFAAAGKLLTAAIKDLVAGKPKAGITAKVNRAVVLAKEGSALLTKASKVIAQLRY